MASNDDRARHGRSKVWFAREFELSIPTVAKRIHDAGIKPIGFVRKKPVYRVVDVAPVLLPPVVQVLTHHGDTGAEDKPIDPDRLPPDLRDKWYASELKKLKLAEQSGDLWPTEHVIEHFGDIAKTLRQTIRLFSDTVERETGLSPKQRQIIEQMSDDLLNTIRQKLVIDPNPDIDNEGAEDEVEPDDAVPDPAADHESHRRLDPPAGTNQRKRGSREAPEAE